VQDVELIKDSPIRGLKAIVFQCDFESCQDWTRATVVISNVMNPVGKENSDGLSSA
jgi:hypothetical protein